MYLYIRITKVVNPCRSSRFSYHWSNGPLCWLDNFISLNCWSSEPFAIRAGFRIAGVAALMLVKQLYLYISLEQQTFCRSRRFLHCWSSGPFCRSSKLV